MDDRMRGVRRLGALLVLAFVSLAVAALRQQQQ